MPSSGIALLAHSKRHPPDDWLPNPSLLPDDGIFKSGPSPGIPGCSNRRRDRGAAFGKLRNCLHQGAPLSWVLLELMATERASCCSWIRWRPQLGDQPQNLGEQHSGYGDLGHLEGDIATVVNDLRADLDKLLLQAGQGPVLDWLGRRQRAQEVAEIVGQRVELETHSIGSEQTAR